MQQDSQQPEGGYPCDMFVTPPPVELTCSICLDVLRDPVQVCSEQHVNCCGCIAQWRAEKKKGCPECRAPLSKKQQHVRIARNVILQLQVRCPHAGPNGGGNSGTTDSPGSSSDLTDADDGHQHKRRRQDNDTGPSSGPASCQWTGPLKDCDAHSEACPFVKVSCPFADAGCGFRAARRDMGAHSSDAAAHLLMVMKRVAVVEAEGTAEKAENEVKFAAVKAESAVLKAENGAMRSRITALEADRNSAARSLQLCVSILQASGEEAAAGGTELVSSLIVPGAGEIPEYTYTGQMRGGERHGLGGVTWATGSLKSYDGQWQEGKIHGQGIMVYSTPDDIYDGWFTDGKRNGQGSYTWIHGTSYKGQWQMGKKHGQGVYTYRNGDSEEGLWEANKRQGQFIFTKADGTRYSRVCKDDTRTSQTRIP